MESKISLQCSRQHSAGHYLFKLHLNLDLPIRLFLSILPTKTTVHIPFLPSVLHALPIMCIW
jgi:hypothetical protein